MFHHLLFGKVQVRGAEGLTETLCSSSGPIALEHLRVTAENGKEKSWAEIMCFIIVLLLRLLQRGVWITILLSYLKVGTRRLCVRPIRRKMKVKSLFSFFFSGLFFFFASCSTNLTTI